jgi:hypothetical protein
MSLSFTHLLSNLTGTLFGLSLQKSTVVPDYWSIVFPLSLSAVAGYHLSVHFAQVSSIQIKT